MTAGIGIDLVEVSRIETLLQKWDDSFIHRVYTENEIAYCRKRGRPAIHFAARFAVKEAFLKAFGMGMGMGIRLRDIETINTAEGKPSIQPHGKAEIMINNRDVKNIHVSITHTKEHAFAVVIAENHPESFGDCLSAKKEGDAAKI